MNAQEKLNQLKAATQALALPYEDQVRLFPNFTLITDELVLRFDDAFKFIEELIKTGELSVDDANFFVKIDEYSENLSNNSKDVFTNPESLKSDPKWEEMRKLARSVLVHMNWKLGELEDRHEVYVQD